MTFSVKDAIFDPFYRYNKPDAVGAYILLSDGTNSRVDYTANVPDQPPVYVQGTQFTGVYRDIKPCSTQGAVVVSAPTDSSSWSKTFDLTAGQGPWIANAIWLGDANVYCHYSAGVGFVGDCITTPGVPTLIAVCTISVPTGTVITSVSFTYTATLGTSPVGVFYYWYNANTVNDGFAFTPSGGTNTQGPQANTNNRDVTAIELVLRAHQAAGPDCGTAAATISSVTINGTGLNPWGGSGNAAVRYSSSYGSTFGSAVVVGTSPGVGGFDIIQVGSTMLAASDKQVKISTSLSSPSFSNAPGGALTSAQPLLIKVPRRNWSNGDNINTSTPDWLLGTDSLDSSACLWKVTGAGVKTNITPSGATAMVGNECAAVWWQNSNYIAVLASVSGVTHLFTTTNGGTSWSDRGAFAGATTVKMRAGPGSQLQLFLDGDTVLKFSKTGGASTASRTKPISSGLMGLEVLG